MNLVATLSLLAGGPGSGCQGPNCGRPITSKGYKGMVRKLERIGVHIKRGTSPWDVVKTYDAWFRGAKVRERIKREAQRGVKRAKAHIARAISKGKLAKIGKKTPGIVKTKGKEHIDVKPVWKGNIKQQYVAQAGHLVTELHAPKQYEKSGRTWLLKASPYKGQFLSDHAGAFNQNTIGDSKEKNSFWIHQAAPDKGVSVEVHRNLGSLKVNVIERRLGEYGAIIDHKEVSFKNVGRAMGFMNKRYGITFKIK